MEPLLFLAHRIPWPANKGDKVRSHNLLRALAARYRVFVGAFVDDPDDRAFIAPLRALAAGLHVVHVRPAWRRVASLAALGRGSSLSMAYYRDEGLGAWIDDTIRRHRIARCYVFSAALAPLVVRRPGMRVVVDFVDVDSEKWREYGRRRRWPLSRLYALEADRLAAAERDIADRAAASVLVTPGEARLLARVAPSAADRIHAIPNGVDTGFFAPDTARGSPYPDGERPIVFTGAMDYWPNIDAVRWFAEDVLPRVRTACPDARFHVVGMNPAPAVRALARSGDIVVTGRVPDVRPYLQHAAVAVAPLRVARGIQNKVLEAMAMARPVVVSRQCAQAIDARAGVEFTVADDAEDFAAAVLSVLERRTDPRMGEAARRAVAGRYAWAPSAARIAALLEGGGTDGAAALGVAPPLERSRTFG
jgi:sugar transferase (PEP-CTERM/EpsH1 system associated)